MGIPNINKNTLELMLTYFSASTAGKTFTPAFCMAWKKFINPPITTELQNSTFKSFWKNAHGIIYILPTIISIYCMLKETH